MSNEKLRECPFCGGEARLVPSLGSFYSNGIKSYSVKCSKCYASTINSEIKYEVIGLWQERREPRCEDCKSLTLIIFNDGGTPYRKCGTIKAWISAKETKDFYCKKFERKDG